jgi:hypothetical protein
MQDNDLPLHLRIVLAADAERAEPERLRILAVLLAIARCHAEGREQRELAPHVSVPGQLVDAIENLLPDLEWNGRRIAIGAQPDASPCQQLLCLGGRDFWIHAPLQGVVDHARTMEESHVAGALDILGGTVWLSDDTSTMGAVAADRDVIAGMHRFDRVDSIAQDVDLHHVTGLAVVPAGHQAGCQTYDRLAVDH